MSILYRGQEVCIISHEKYAEKIYRNTKSSSNCLNFVFNKDLFNITNPYIHDTHLHNYINDVNSSSPRKKKKAQQNNVIGNSSVCEEVNHIKLKFFQTMNIDYVKQIFSLPSKKNCENNIAARNASKYHFENITKSSDVKNGVNINGYPIIVFINDKEFLIPPLSQFFNCNILDLTKHIILDGQKFSFILLDPPWRNKYIRRKRKKNEEEGYRMMYDSEISSIPLQKLLAEDGLVAVWCTNSPSHIKAVINDIFPSWNLQYISTWFWIKVTKTGEPVCEFSNPPGKQPYERIMFGCHPQRSNLYKQPEDNKILISVPSAIHSHKPPLVEVINEYLGDAPKCLELFARYLLPQWTSCGDQVLSLQNINLYNTITEKLVP